MKATKYTVIIKAECLSVDSVPSLLIAAMEQVRRESSEGEIIKDDGDSVIWETKSKKVEF